MGEAAALLIIDVIHPFDFRGASALVRATRRIVPALLRTRAAFDRAGLPTIYCNDNFGQWRSDFRAVIDACTKPDNPGADVVGALLPRPSDYFVLKPRHSAFHATPLAILLASLQVRHVYVAGIAADACVIDSVVDAHMHDLVARVVSDAVAAETPARCRRALQLVAARGVARLVRSGSVGRTLRTPARGQANAK